MVIEPEIRASAHAATGAHRSVRLEIAVPRELHYFQGHFPGCALLPGVVQITWAVELARRFLQTDGSFSGVDALKFMRVIQPGDALTLSLSFDAAAKELEFEYRGPAGVCASGVALFN